MLGFVIRRLLISIPVVIVVSFLVFLMVASSGDPLAELRARPNVPAQVIEARREQLHLDRPIITRYGIWAKGFVRGDFGKTLGGRPVRTLLWERLQVTLRMVVLATLIGVAVAITAGVISAVRQYTVTDYSITFFGFLFLSMPVFWLAALLKEYGAIRLNNLFGKQIVFTVGESTPNLTGSLFHRWADYAGHLALPTLSLVLISMAGWSRYQRASMLDVTSSDYIRLARAKGLSRSRVMVRHALRNALIPITTVVALDFGAVLGGAVITEKVFAWQGMGAMLIDAVNNIDVNEMLAWLMVTTILVITFNLVADILYAYLDPRIRYD
jgi:peptide/nickel transport system permease protein